MKHFASYVILAPLVRSAPAAPEPVAAAPVLPQASAHEVDVRNAARTEGAVQ